MSKHTPGPWEYNYSRYDGRRLAEFYINADKYCIAVCNSNEPNARLIAAAPDMLVALQEIVNNLDPGDFVVPTSFSIQRARAAIAKATGQEEKKG